jgi:hypothetical protein
MLEILRRAAIFMHPLSNILRIEHRRSVNTPPAQDAAFHGRRYGPQVHVPSKYHQPYNATNFGAKANLRSDGSTYLIRLAPSSLSPVLASTQTNPRAAAHHQIHNQPF